MEIQNNIPNITGIRIREMRLEKNWTQKDLANKLGLKNETAIANYESGYSIPKDEVKSKMCEIFGCTMDYLMGKSNFKNFTELKSSIITEYEKKYYITDLYNALIAVSLLFTHSVLKPSDRSKIQVFLEKYYTYDIPQNDLENFVSSFPANKQKALRAAIDEILDSMKMYKRNREEYSAFKTDLENSNHKYYMCPVYGRIAAGEPNWAEECMEGYLPISPELMNIINPEECYFLKVNGESMNKVIKNGSFALIRKTDWVENGEIAVVLVNGYDATLKKFTKQGDLIILEPMSNDPSFQTQAYGKDTEIKIIGKYIGKMEMN